MRSTITVNQLTLILPAKDKYNQIAKTGNMGIVQIYLEVLVWNF